MFLIKGLLSGKSLKQLFIIGLISCFTLSVGSFVSATAYVYQNNTESVNQKTAGYTLNVFGKGNLLSKAGGYTKSMLFSSNGYYFFRTESGIPYIHGGTSNHYGLVKVYYLCNGLRSSSCLSFPCSISDINMNGCSSNNVGDGSVNVFSSFMSSISTDDVYLLNERSGDLYVCFDNTSLNSNICFYSSLGSTTGHVDYGSDFSSINSNLMANSPGYNGGNGNSGNSFNVYTGSRLKGMLGTEGEYTNLEMVHGFEGIGLFSDLCYGGFPIDNIFNPSESFEDFTGYKAGQGATIFDLYSLYTGFSSMNQFLNTILTRYQNGQINSFKTEPKALLMVGSQLNVAGVKTSYISEYCDLYLNSDYREVYTGNTVDSVRVKNYLNNQFTRNILKTLSGENITMQTTNNVGVFSSGDSVEFDPDTFFSNIMDEITTKLNNPTKGGAVGLLPGYIIVVLLGIVFIRLISH